MIGTAVILSVALGSIAALHVYWGLGGLWPERTPAALAAAVFGDGRKRMPPPWQCFAVAALLVAVAAWAWLILWLPEVGWVAAGGLVIVATFVVRAMAAYSPRWRAAFPAEPFATRDRLYYGPLCLLLAVGYATLLEKVL
ncbi:MAG: DUF3995 domain-containing protein [Alphaproteobacteria bacterium]|nr:DUF3995 domain-containing protein [Alphaproteobacteria bacterium]